MIDKGAAPKAHPGTLEQIFHPFVCLEQPAAVRRNIVVKVSTGPQKICSPPGRLGTGIAYHYHRIDEE
jgi:hypothetical protein